MKEKGSIVMLMKKNLRKLIGARENEKIFSAIERKFIRFEKHIYKEKFTTFQLKNELIKLGISSGDCIFLHSSYRSFYNFIGKPEDIINIILDLIGDEGTLLMPSYGSSLYRFDVNNTPSVAGVLSEIFRMYPGVIRSNCTHFSVVGKGYLAKDLLSEHINSVYGFDQYSPLFKLTKFENTKILFMGLGRKPTKISLFHCAGHILQSSDSYLQKVISKKYESILIVDGESFTKNMIIRNSSYKNNNKVFKEIFNGVSQKSNQKISNLDLVIMDAKESYDLAIKYAKNGKYCYKKRWLL